MKFWSTNRFASKAFTAAGEALGKPRRGVQLLSLIRSSDPRHLKPQTAGKTRTQSALVTEHCQVVAASKLQGIKGVCALLRGPVWTFCSRVKDEGTKWHEVPKACQQS